MDLEKVEFLFAKQNLLDALKEFRIPKSVGYSSKGAKDGWKKPITVQTQTKNRINAGKMWTQSH